MVTPLPLPSPPGSPSRAARAAGTQRTPGTRLDGGSFGLSVRKHNGAFEPRSGRTGLLERRLSRSHLSRRSITSQTSSSFQIIFQSSGQSLLSPYTSTCPSIKGSPQTTYGTRLTSLSHDADLSSSLETDDSLDPGKHFPDSDNSPISTPGKSHTESMLLRHHVHFQPELYEHPELLYVLDESSDDKQGKLLTTVYKYTLSKTPPHLQQSFVAIASVPEGKAKDPATEEDKWTLVVPKKHRGRIKPYQQPKAVRKLSFGTTPLTTAAPQQANPNGALAGHEMVVIRERVGSFLTEGQRRRMLFYLEQEIAIHKGLNHKNIVQCLGCSYLPDPENLRLCLFTTFGGISQKETLERLAQSEGEGKPITGKALRERQVSSLLDQLRQLVHALHYLKNNSVLHRDIKPGNVCMYGDTLKLIDFGLACSLIPKGPVNARGTPLYMSPEARAKQEQLTPSDIYSAGVCTAMVARRTGLLDIDFPGQNGWGIEHVNPRIVVRYPEQAGRKEQLLRNLANGMCQPSTQARHTCNTIFRILRTNAC